MSNEYFNYGNTLIPGDLARAEDVKSELEGVQTGFDRLPSPRNDGTKGFAEPIFLVEATEDGHAVTLGQVNGLEQLALGHATAAQAAQASAEAARDAAEVFRDSAEYEADRAANANVTLDGYVTQCEDFKTQAQTAKTLAQDWASKPIDQTVDGAGTRSALHYADKAKQWAEADLNVNVDGTQKSAKHWALTAAATVTGAKKYIGLHNASGGAYPIATPTVGDEGKYWLISVAGTLPLGAVSVGWELSINSSLAYEVANLNPGMITQVNGKTGPTVTLTPGDIGAAPSSHAHTVYLEKTDNLAAVNNKATARTNLGLGSAATLNTGTAAGQIPVRDSNGKTPGDITGAAATAASATKLATARTITLAGDLSGSASTDFSGNVTITANVTDDSHDHRSIITTNSNTPPFDNANRTPREYSLAGICTLFVHSAYGWPISSGKLVNIPSHTPGQDGGAMQILIPYDEGYTANGNPLFRVGYFDNAGWSPWRSWMDKDWADARYLTLGGTAAKASKLANARTITLSGDISGVSPAFDGTANISMSVTLAASSLLAKIKSVDGAGSGLDADTLDGLQSSSFVKTSDANFQNPGVVWSGSTTSLSLTAFPSNGLYLVTVSYTANSNVAWVILPYYSGAACSSGTIAVTGGPLVFLSTFQGALRVYRHADGANDLGWEIGAVRRVAV